MKRYKKIPTNEPDEFSIRHLLCAIIEQAIVDYKTLVAAGRIVKGEVVPFRGERRFSGGYRTDLEVRQLIDFLMSDVMDQWFSLGRIKMNPNFIRLKLGLIPGVESTVPFPCRKTILPEENDEDPNPDELTP